MTEYRRAEMYFLLTGGLTEASECDSSPSGMR